MTNKVENGAEDYLVKLHSDTIPARLPGTVYSTMLTELDKTSKHMNKFMYNKTLQTCSDMFCKTDELIHNSNRKLLAKAWRTVKRSNRDVASKDFRINKQSILTINKISRTETDKIIDTGKTTPETQIKTDLVYKEIQIDENVLTGTSIITMIVNVSQTLTDTTETDTDNRKITTDPKGLNQIDSVKTTTGHVPTDKGHDMTNVDRHTTRKSITIRPTDTDGTA